MEPAKQTDLPSSVGKKQDELMQPARPVDDIDIRLNRWLIYFASNPGWYPVGEFIAADATSAIERAIEVFGHGLAYRAEEIPWDAAPLHKARRE
jgi:hypothetical protein